MKISLKAILERLGDRISHTQVSTDKELWFSQIQPLTPGAESLKEETLYFCLEWAALPEDLSTPEEKCLVVEEGRPCLWPCNYLVVKKGCLMECMARALDVLDQVNSFMEKLQAMIIAGEGYDKIFRLAAQQFRDRLLLMTDSAYNIDWSTMDDVDDPYLHALLARGYYNKDDVDSLARHGYFDDQQRVTRPRRYSPDQTVSGKELLLRSYQRRGLLLGFVACYILEGAATELDLLLFKALTDCLERSVIAQADVRLYDMPSEQLMMDLLEPGTDDDENRYRDRCARLGLPYKCSYRIGVIRSGSGKESTAAGITKSLMINCPIKTYGIFKYRAEVILVFHDWSFSSVREASSLEEKIKMLEATLRASRCRMGVSLGFDSMEHFKIGYLQAQSAITASEPLRDLEAEPLQFYFDWYLQDMLSVYDKTMDLGQVYAHRLDQLADMRHGECDDLRVLYAYLRTERNITETARRLNMHRNGVSYRMKKVEERLGMDLDDPDVRMRLLLSYEILKKLGRLSDEGHARSQALELNSFGKKDQDLEDRHL